MVNCGGILYFKVVLSLSKLTCRFLGVVGCILTHRCYWDQMFHACIYFSGRLSTTSQASTYVEVFKSHRFISASIILRRRLGGLVHLVCI